MSGGGVTITPPFAYYGGKTTLAQRIADLLPDHEHYVEPFAGSLAVLLAKRPSKMETVNDLSQDLMTFWRVLRDQPDELTRLCALTPHSRAQYGDDYSRDGLTDLERARRVWSVLAQGRTGTLKRTGWRFHADPHGSSLSMSGRLASYVERIPPVARRLAGVSLECRPAVEVIAAYGAVPDAVIYADPPYLGSTRNGQNYGHEMPTEAEHAALAEALHDCAATVVLSGYRSPLYDDLYGDWHVTEIATATGQGGTWQPRTEVLWSNRTLGEPDLFGEEAS